jgi:phosphate-selective porin OprO/OprP
VWLGTAAIGAAQTEDLPPPPGGYQPIIPDLPQDVHDHTSVDSRWFTLRFGAAPILDYTWFTQDAASLEQVGRQKDDFDIRSARVMVRGNLFNDTAHPWRYLLSFEYRGFDSDPDHDWNFTDVAVTIPAGPVGDLSVGKLKESFVYEMVGDAANLPHMERLLSPFFTSRSWGARLNRTVFDKRATVAIGAFNDWFAKDIAYSDSGWDVAGRVTALPWMDASGRRFLHVAGSWRYVGADEGVVRYRGRAESNVSDYYVDTGKIPASHANNFGGEVLWNEGPVSVLAEYTAARVCSVDGSDPACSGWYVTGSWILTGEHRPYDKSVGYARRVLPRHRWGAVEVIARYGNVDTTDHAIDGGVMDKWFAAVNWWATRRWRFSLGGGRAALDRSALVGHTNQVLARVQWIY